eukprot:Tbor_TRINITY_DN5245_c0_g2::TRINITY_DN5245_c0_g2_i1::g.16308::m.16308
MLNCIVKLSPSIRCCPAKISHIGVMLSTSASSPIFTTPTLNHSPLITRIPNLPSTSPYISPLATTNTDQRRLFSSSTVALMRKFKGKRGPKTRESKEGDWLCQCGETNYRSKRECYKCGAPAPPLPPGVRRPSLPGEDPHDWACPCGQMNFRASVSCYKCMQHKPVAPPPPGQEVTMWTCPGCKGVNRNTRKNCFKCFALAPPSVVLISKAS